MIEPEHVRYTAHATSTAGREGTSKSIGAQAPKIVEGARQVCRYSNATRGNNRGPLDVG